MSLFAATVPGARAPMQMNLISWHLPSAHMTIEAVPNLPEPYPSSTGLPWRGQFPWERGTAAFETIR